MNIKAPESVQRWVTKLKPSLQVNPYEECLASLKLPTLVYQRKREDAMATRKLLENDLWVKYPAHTFQTRREVTQISCKSLVAIDVSTDNFYALSLTGKPLRSHHPVPNHKCIQERSWSGIGQCRGQTNKGCQTIVTSHHQRDVPQESHQHLNLLAMQFKVIFKIITYNRLKYMRLF